MTRYEGFENLAFMMGLERTERGYAKFIQTGKLPIYDYNTGFIDLHIYSTIGANKKPYVRLYFATVDDGDFGGWLECADKLEANRIVEEIAYKIFKNMVSFPDHDTLNKLLCPYGLYVDYE